MASNEYCEITIDIFLKMTGVVPFDVFVQLSPEKFTRVFNRGDSVDRQRFENYLGKGVEKLFILRSERRTYIDATERLIKKTLTQKPVDIDAASRAVEELSEQTLFEVFEDKLFDETTLRYAQLITKTYVHFLKSDIRVLTQFLTLCHKETYMVRHSISTALFSILIAKADRNSNDRIFEIVGMGGLLHDLGMSALPAEINDVDRKLSSVEWTQVKQHTNFGKDMTSSIKLFPSDVLTVIQQHHEAFDGTGYPRGLKGDSIYYPARVVSIADCFSALTTKRGGRSLFSPDDALSVLMTEQKKYDPKLLTVFEVLLNPKKRKTG